jgi:fructose-1,6-bisphosphatase/inositol monophosphatase family enzyme
MHPTLNIAIKAARKAGDIILRYHNQIELLTIENKAANDFVSEVDKAAEDAINKPDQVQQILHGECLPLLDELP